MIFFYFIKYSDQVFEVFVLIKSNYIGPVLQNCSEKNSLNQISNSRSSKFVARHFLRQGTNPIKMNLKKLDQI